MNSEKSFFTRAFFVISLLVAFSFSVVIILLIIFKTKESAERCFFDSAMWVQAIAMIAAAVFSYFLLSQIRLTKEQLKIQQKLAAAEINKKLASREYSQVRRFLYQESIQKFFNSLGEAYKDVTSDTYTVRYDDFLLEFNRVKRKQKYLFISVQDIEMLLNEYNHIGMLFRGEVLEKNMFTEKAIENAEKIYKILRSYIKLRRIAKNSEKYALDFECWVDKDINKCSCGNDLKPGFGRYYFSFIKAFDY